MIERGAARRPSYLCWMRAFLAFVIVLGIACGPPHPSHLSDPSPARVVSQGSAQLTMEVQELI